MRTRHAAGKYRAPGAAPAQAALLGGTGNGEAWIKDTTTEVQLMEEKSSCKIRRSGLVRELDGPSAVLEIEGRTVRVPAGKIAAGTAAGTPVQWNGTLWIPFK
ncbi:hypothetical protein [Paenibacillus sp. RC84]|uniref:hypothetical protein n=1 Tax=Paenibacillus sp. RC84 TaxID=3156252 RepID=UPI003518C422